MKNTIVHRVKCHDEQAVCELIEQYRYLILKVISLFNLKTKDYIIDKDDLIQEAYIALYKAAMTYDEEMDVKFSTYAYTIIHRKISRIVYIYTGIYRFEGKTIDENNNLETKCSYSQNQENIDPKYMFEYNERVILINNFLNGLKEEERNIIELRNSKHTYKEISKMTGRSVKNIDYTIQKMKKQYKSKVDEILA